MSDIYIYTGWWFGTMQFYDFPKSWDDDPTRLLFFRGVETTNHIYKTKNMTLGLSENDVKTHSIQWIMMISHYKIAIKWVFLDTSIWS